MKKPRTLSLILMTCLSAAALASCGSVDNGTKPDPEIYAIYRKYQENGGTLSYEEWLESIKGEKGDPGEQGPKGDTGASLLIGEGAPSQELGRDGDSYIDTFTWNYYLKENGAWALAGNLKGPDGENGRDGENGANGKDGKSAYEIFLESHPEYTGTEEEWLDDLINGRLGTQQTHTVTFNSNGGSEVAPQEVLHGERIQKPDDPERTGYTFSGWTYRGEPWVFFGYVVTEDITLDANWSINSYSATITSMDTRKGTVAGGGVFDYQTEIIASASPSYGFRFEGWYSDEEMTNKVSEDNPYSFPMGAENVHLFGNFVLDESLQEWNLAHGMIPSVNASELTATYGLYPQTNVNNSDLISALNNLAPTSVNGWYFYENEYYAKVEADPLNSDYVFDNGKKIVSKNIYWFLCKPIKWKVLNITGGEYLLLSDVLLDKGSYCDTKEGRTINGQKVAANDYEYSRVRSWLNGAFFETAFLDDGAYITITENDNTPLGNSAGGFAYYETNDRVFLPSYQDYTNTSYGFSTTVNQTEKSRQSATTDYFRAIGGYYNQNSSVLYNGYYWARTPGTYGSYQITNVGTEGKIWTDGNPTETWAGIRPAITLNY